MDEHRKNLLARRLAVLLLASLFSPCALAQSTDSDEEFDPPPDPEEPRGYVDIPEIGMEPPGGSPDLGDPEDSVWIDWDVFGDGTSGHDIHTGTTADHPNFLLPPDPGDLIVDSEPISAEDILGSPASSDLDGVNLDPVITIPISSGDLTPGSSDLGAPVNSNGVPTPGSGVLFVGGLMLLGSRRRRR